MKFLHLIIIVLLFPLTCSAAEGDFPAIYETTTRLNVRSSASTRASKITTLAPNTRIQVEYITSNGWAAIKYNNRERYVSAKYIRYLKSAVPETPAAVEPMAASSRKGFSILSAIPWVVGFAAVCFFSLIILRLFITVAYKVYWLASLPFYILNWIQRYASKPWRIFYKNNNGRDTRNSELRDIYEWVKIPLYIILTPLRFVNAFYYNMMVHCSFEMLNYISEVLVPNNPKEGKGNIIMWVTLMPWRILKYPLWHGSLTFAESAIWTMVDTVVPALTLYHGTSEQASATITGAGRDGYSCCLTGIWNVGGGNFAGNGIYFAPARNTAMHYSKGSLIVCRVSLGKVLDLGLAPWHVYRQCGNANALGATRWGLQNGFVTGEWWRKDAGWWEYCTYDWQNRYNYSWRIRPLYVLNLDDKCLQLISGGMCHWLFRKLVVKDIGTYLEECLN